MAFQPDKAKAKISCILNALFYEVSKAKTYAHNFKNDKYISLNVVKGAVGLVLLNRKGKLDRWN